MAKNYSEDTKECLVWFRMDDDAGPEADDDYAGQQEAPIVAGGTSLELGTRPRGKRVPTITRLDGKTKATPHRSEGLNASHFSVASGALPEAQLIELHRRGRRTLNSVRKVMDEDADPTAVAGRPRPLSPNMHPSEMFLTEQKPKVSLKKPYKEWRWQQPGRGVTLKHQEDANTAINAAQQADCLKKEKQRQRREKFREHLRQARMKSTNRFPMRQVPGVHFPKPQPPEKKWIVPTIPRPPVFSARLACDRCQPRSGHHPAPFLTDAAVQAEIASSSVMPPPSSHPAAASAATTVTTTTATKSSVVEQKAPRPPSAAAPKASVSDAKLIPSRPQTARQPKRATVFAGHEQPTSARASAAEPTDEKSVSARPMSSRVRRKIVELYDVFLTPRRSAASNSTESMSPR